VDKTINTFKDYVPLLVMVVVTALAGYAVNTVLWGGFMGWMQFFMGFFLCSFAMVKLFNLQGFADGFQMYDLVGKRFRPYALAYPFIELALGLGYLSFYKPHVVYVITMVIAVVGTVGVLKALRAGLNVKCACMGSILNVPLSTVTLSENIAAGVMALWMWVRM